MRGERLLTTNHAGQDLERPWLLRGQDDHRSPGLLSEDEVVRAIWESHRRSVIAARQSLGRLPGFEGGRVTATIPFSPDSRALLRKAMAESTDELLRSPFARSTALASERLAWLRDAAVVHVASLGPDEFTAIIALGDRLPDSELVHQRPGRVAMFPERPSAAPGVDVVGHLRSTSGLGTAGRRIVKALRSTALAVSACDISMSLNRSVLDCRERTSP